MIHERVQAWSLVKRCSRLRAPERKVNPSRRSRVEPPRTHTRTEEPEQPPSTFLFPLPFKKLFTIFQSQVSDLREAALETNRYYWRGKKNKKIHKHFWGRELNTLISFFSESPDQRVPQCPAEPLKRGDRGALTPQPRSSPALPVARLLAAPRGFCALSLWLVFKGQNTLPESLRDRRVPRPCPTPRPRHRTPPAHLPPQHHHIRLGFLSPHRWVPCVCQPHGNGAGWPA